MKNILALDLGTDTGWALNHGSVLSAGTWNLATSSEIAEWGRDRTRRRKDRRIIRFFEALQRVDAEHHIDIVIFEDVQFSSSTAQTQLWSSFRGALWCAFPETVIYECVPTGKLKIFGANHGGATKDMMKNSLLRLHSRWKGVNLSDDAVDALWLWYWANDRLKNLIYGK
jgi:hypothetical protein